MNPQRILYRATFFLLFICSSTKVYSESILGVSKNTICPGESIDFWDNLISTNQPEKSYVFTIDFGDGTKQSVNQSHCYFQHVFSVEGQYKIHLLAVTEGESIEDETIIYVRKDIIPESFLDVSKNTLSVICPGTAVYFQTDWNQNFVFDYGDGSTGISGQHTYEKSGVFHPHVIVQNVCGNKMIYGEHIITVGNKSGFSGFAEAFIDGGAAYADGFPVNTAIQFKSMSADSYRWVFDGSSQSKDQNPSHTYNKPGKHIVSLTLYDGCSNDTTIFLNVNILPEKQAEVSIPLNTDKLEVFPNPNKGEINLRMNVGDCKQALIQLYDPSGILVKEMNFGPIAGEIRDKILLSSPKTGIYTICLKTDRGSYQRKLIIDK